MANRKIGTIMVMMIAAVTVSLFVPAFAQGHERVIGSPLPGAFPHTIPGGAITPAGWDNNRGMEVIVGGILGGFLVDTIQDNQYRDRDCYYPDRDRGRHGDWDRNHRQYGPKHRRYEDRRWSRYDREWRYDHSPRVLHDGRNRDR